LKERSAELLKERKFLFTEHLVVLDKESVQNLDCSEIRLQDKPRKACIQIGKHLGLEVIGTAGSANGAALVEAQGITCYRHDDPEYLEKMKTGEGGFDLIVEMLANKNLENDLTMLNVGSGRVMVNNCII
jgi:hypothetical protein